MTKDRLLDKIKRFFLPHKRIVTWKEVRENIIKSIGAEKKRREEEIKELLKLRDQQWIEEIETEMFVIEGTLSGEKALRLYDRYINPRGNYRKWQELKKRMEAKDA